MHDRPATIREVADDAGVGTATVSRALNEPWRVSPDTTARVMASVEKLDYKPNFRARLLARGNSGTICFLLSNRPFIHSIHGQILQAAACEADMLGVQIVYASCRYEASATPPEIELPQILAARGLIDGVIVAGTNYPSLLQAVDTLNLPYVVFGTNLITNSEDRLPNGVYVDEEGGGRLAALHLISLGHSKIRFIGDTALPWYRNRYRGFSAAMAGAGLECHEAVGKAKGDPHEMGETASNLLLDQGAEFTAIFAGSDRVAHGAMKALRGRGLCVPGDVSIIGFDDEEIAWLSEPPLTTIRMPTEEIGAQCVLLLNDMVRGGKEPREPIVLAAQLVARESTRQRSK